MSSPRWLEDKLARFLNMISHATENLHTGAIEVAVTGRTLWPTNQIMESQKSPAQLDERIFVCYQGLRAYPPKTNLFISIVRARLLGRFFGGWWGLRKPINRLSVVCDIGTHRLVGSAILVDQWHQQILEMRLDSFYLSWRVARQIGKLRASRQVGKAGEGAVLDSWFFWFAAKFWPNICTVSLSHHILVLEARNFVQFPVCSII